MSWGNGNVEIAYNDFFLQWTITITDPDGIGKWVVRAGEAANSPVFKSGVANREEQFKIVIEPGDFNLSNKLRASYRDCRKEPATEVWVVSPLAAKNDPCEPIRGECEDEGEPF